MTNQWLILVGLLIMVGVIVSAEWWLTDEEETSCPRECDGQEVYRVEMPENDRAT